MHVLSARGRERGRRTTSGTGCVNGRLPRAVLGRPVPLAASTMVGIDVVALVARRPPATESPVLGVRWKKASMPLPEGRKAEEAAGASAARGCTTAGGPVAGSSVGGGSTMAGSSDGAGGRLVDWLADAPSEEAKIESSFVMPSSSRKKAQQR